ncbi:MAG: flippase [Pseudomonadota bacterium]
MLERIIENISWLFFDKVVRLGMGLIVGIWVARYLGPEQYGLLNFGIATVALFAIFVKLGLQSIVVRDLVNNPEETGVTIGTAAAMQMVGAAFAYLLLTIAITYMRPDDQLARTIVLLLGLTLFLKGFDTAKFWFESQVRSKYVVWLANAVFLALSAVKVVLILSGAPLLAFAWVTVADAIIVGIGSILLFFHFGPGRKALRFSLARARELVADSWPLLLSSAAIAIYMKVDMVMLGQMADDKEVGIYAVATKISEIWHFVPLIIVASVFPSIMNAKKKDETSYLRRFQTLFDLMVWLSILIAIPVSLFSTFIINQLFSNQYSEAGIVLSIHTWALIFVFYGAAWSKWVIIEKYTDKILYLHISASIINVGLNLILIDPLGAKGAAIATVISYGIGHTLLIYIQSDLRRSGLFFLNAVTLRRLWDRE